MERLLIALLAGCTGIIIGLFGPTLFGPAQQAVETEQNWLYPLTPTPASTQAPLVLPRATAAQTAVPPTLKPFTPPQALPPPTPVPAVVPGIQPPSAHTFVIPLKGGGEMTVVANDEAAARNNVKSQGGIPAD